MGAHFTLVTDNMPNTYLDTQPTLSRRQARWSEYLQRYNYTWVHRPGKHNVADPLSRNPSFRQLHAILAAVTRRSTHKTDSVADTNTRSTDKPTTEPSAKRTRKTGTPATGANSTDMGSTDLVSKIAQTYAEDPYFTEETNTKDLTLLDGIRWQRDLIFVSDNNDIKQLILREFHDSPYVGHMGVTKTRGNIQRYFTWRNLYAEVAAYVKHCPSCQVQKSSSSRPTGLLQPLEVPPYAWHTVTTDYMMGLPKTAKGNTAIVVFVDKLTKYVYLVACSKESSALDWVNMFIDHVYIHHGLPEKLVSDGDHNSPALSTNC